MARYIPLSAAHRAAAMRDIEMTLAAGSARSNPAGKTIKARRTSTCPISDEKIEVGDSITKTESGWALTKHVRAAKSKPQHFTKGKGSFRRAGPAEQLAIRQKAAMSQSRYYPFDHVAHFDVAEEMRNEAERARQSNLYKQVENPSLGGAAMKYARAHGVSLKQGWAAVKAGKANPYYENPSMGGRAMQYSRAHGVSLKEGWKAVKSGRA